MAVVRRPSADRVQAMKPGPELDKLTAEAMGWVYIGQKLSGKDCLDIFEDLRGKNIGYSIWDSTYEAEDGSRRVLAELSWATSERFIQVCGAGLSLPEALAKARVLAWLKEK